MSAFGGDGQSDGGDVWQVEWDGKAKYWKQDNKARPGVGGGAACGPLGPPPREAPPPPSPTPRAAG